MSDKVVGILQSNYIPWKGYFDLICRVDEFVIYDEVQYTKNDWRNRNLIKTPEGLNWITIPVKHISLNQRINETYVADNRWRKKHWESIKQNYSKARYFRRYSEVFAKLYLDSAEENLSVINFSFLKSVLEILEIRTQLSYSTNYPSSGDRLSRLIQICKQTDASVYVSGPSGAEYIDTQRFKNEKIEVQYIEYSDYPIYKQLYGDFEHRVSILDLIFNEGENAKKFLRSTPNK